MADHITEVIERIQKATGYHATEILDEAQPPLHEILGDFAVTLLREGFEAGRFAIETRDGWDFEPYPGYEDDGEMDEAFQTFLTQRQQEKDEENKRMTTPDTAPTRVHLIPLPKGESLLPIPHAVAAELNLHAGDTMEVTIREGTVVLTPVRINETTPVS